MNNDIAHASASVHTKTAAATFNVAADQCHLVPLHDQKGVQDFLNLHLVVYNNLSAVRRQFMKRRLFKDLKAHIEGGHYMMALYTPDKQMAAQALVAFPDRPGASHLNGYPIGPGNLDPKTSAVVQALGIHPNARGEIREGYSNAILKAVDAVAEGMGREDLLAKMSAHNFRSKAAFERVGFKKLEPDRIVPGESYISSFMHKVLAP